MNRNLLHPISRKIFKLKNLRYCSTEKRKNAHKVNCAIYGCGLSASGALALPKLFNSDSDVVISPETKLPKRIPFFNTENIRHVSSGFGFSLFASSKRLYGSGLNNRFQIAGHVGDIEKNKGQEYYISAKKIKIPLDEGKIIQISSGRAHSLILTTEGVYAIGENCFGQCGINPDVSKESLGFGDNILRKIEIDSDYPIKSVHCSLDTSFLVNTAGEVFSFGLNEDGQCCNESFGIQWKPTKIKGDVNGEKIMSVCGSTDTLMALSESGEVFIWGQTEYNQAAEVSDDIQLNVSRRVCLSSGIGRISSVASTSTSCLISNENGEAYVWGVGVIGLGPSTDRLKRPTKMDEPLFENRKITKVFGGNNDFGALNDRGRLFVWGENRFSLLGLGHKKRQNFPYQLFLPGNVKDFSIGPDHSIIMVY